MGRIPKDRNIACSVSFKKNIFFTAVAKNAFNKTVLNCSEKSIFWSYPQPIKFHYSALYHGKLRRYGGRGVGKGGRGSSYWTYKITQKNTVLKKL